MVSSLLDYCYNPDNLTYSNCTDTGAVLSAEMVNNAMRQLQKQCAYPMASYATSGTHNPYYENEEKIRNKEVEIRKLRDEIEGRQLKKNKSLQGLIAYYYKR